MADDITLNSGSGGDTLGADDIGGVKYQIVKAGLGALDSLTLLDGNSGNKSAGTLRVVLATDQPALTNKLLVTPDLPSGASTAAKQPALGTAGTASADVITVQGIASMTALKVDGSGVTQPVSGTVTANPASGTIDTVTTVGTVTNVVHVDDNGGALTVDGTVAVTHAALTELASALNAEDVATAGADAGMVILARRTDTPANQSGTDGDLEIPQMSAGRLWVDASGKTLTVDGSGVTQPVSDGGGAITVDWAGTAPPIGAGVEATALRVTVATDSTGVLSVDDNGGALTVDNGGTFAVQATVAAGATNIAKAEDAASANADVGIPAMAVQKATPANTAGTDGDYEFLQMSAGRLWASATIDAALPAGTNAIGKLAANSGVDIGDIDVTSIIPGTGATNLGKAEDAAHSSGDVGVMALAVRAASPTERSAGPTDGDYEPLATNEVGALWASLTPSVNGGLTTAMFSGSDGSSILVATAQVVKASAGALYGYYAYNPEAAASFVHFYNVAAASVTVGTTNPLMTFAIPAGSAANLSFPMGVTFSNAGWSVAATTTAGGNSAPATGVSLVCWYK